MDAKGREYSSGRVFSVFSASDFLCLHCSRVSLDVPGIPSPNAACTDQLAKARAGAITRETRVTSSNGREREREGERQPGENVPNGESIIARVAIPDRLHAPHSRPEVRNKREQ